MEKYTTVSIGKSDKGEKEVNGIFDNIKIVGVSCSVPSYIMKNMDFADCFGKKVIKKHSKMTGVKEHRLSNKYQKISDLCISAARELINKLNWNKTEIKVLLLITQSEDYAVPSTAIAVADELGLGKDCLAYDINLGCSAFDIGAQTVASILQSQIQGTKALLLVGDVASNFTLEENLTINVIKDRMLFGSAGAAVAVERSSNNSFVFANYSDGSQYDAIMRYPQTELHMDGGRVLEFAINDVVECINDFRERNHLTEDSIDFYVFHQAQKLIIDCIVDGCKILESKVLNSYEQFGNTSGASIPLSIVTNLKKMKKDKVRILSCGFGVGLSIGISYFELETDNVVPLIETDYYSTKKLKRNGFLYSAHALMMDMETEVDRLMARKLDDYSCSLGVYGTRAQIDELKEQLFWQEGNEFFISDKELFAAENTYDAVLISLAQKSSTDIKKVVKKCIDMRSLNDNASFILYGQEVAQQFKLFELLEEIEQESKGMYRANAVLFHLENFEIIPVIKDDINWLTDQRVMNGNNKAIYRPYRMVSEIARLVGDRASEVSKTIIHISDR